MRTNRPFAVLGAAGALTAPAAVALADEPSTPATPGDPGALHAELGDPTVRAQMRDHQHQRLLRTHRRLSRRLGQRQADARVWSNGHLRRDISRLRDQVRARETATTSSTGGPAPSAGLQAIAACESGGDPHAIGGGGAFRGKYQFTYASWQAVGGSGDPAAAPEAEQDRRAAMLMARSGAGNWPVCAA